MDVGDGHGPPVDCSEHPLWGWRREGGLPSDAISWVSLASEVLGVSLGPMGGGLRTRLLVGGGSWKRRRWLVLCGDSGVASFPDRGRKE